MSANPRVRLLPDGPHIEIDGGSLYLGRDCILAVNIPVLLNRLVSNRHMRIWFDGSRWMLEDLGSTNGTWLRGQRVGAAMPLRLGDIIALGRNGPRLAWEPPGSPKKFGAGATLLDEDAADAPTIPDGSDERPFLVGQTPEIVVRHQRTGQEFRAQGYTIVLGRDPAAAQILVRSDTEKHVSGAHAEIQFRSDGSVKLRDLGSRNGTWLNNAPVESEVPIHAGDLLVLGAAATTLVALRLG